MYAFVGLLLFLHGCGRAMSRQEVLKEAWMGGRAGYMPGETQAKAWALRQEAAHGPAPAINGTNQMLHQGCYQVTCAS